MANTYRGLLIIGGKTYKYDEIIPYIKWKDKDGSIKEAHNAHYGVEIDMYGSFCIDVDGTPYCIELGSVID